MLRILSVAAAVVLIAAGCGSSVRSHRAAPHLPRALAQQWAGEASTIADVAAAGDGCTARRLAGTLRAEVMGAGATIPASLGTPLLEAVNALFDRITCVPAPKPPGHKKPPKPGPDHHHHDHHGDGGGQGGQS